MKKQNFGDRIKSARIKAGMSQEALADKIGISKQSISAWERGISKKIEGENLVKAAQVLGVSESWIQTGLDSAKHLKGFQNIEATLNSAKVPLIDMVAAGDWCEVADPYPAGEAESWEPCPVPHGENTFAVRINGESMAPKFQHGEIIFCDPSVQPNNGDYVIAKLIDENQATFKQLIMDDGQYMLKALNPNWPNPYIPINGNCQIVGKVIARLEKF